MLPGNENISSCDLVLHPLLHITTMSDLSSDSRYVAVVSIRYFIAITAEKEVFIVNKKHLSTEMIVIIGFMIALEIVLSKLVSINISFLRIGFGFLPIAILAILYGPLWSGIAYAIGDVIGGFLFPTGAFFPGFTVTAFATGVIFGLVLYKKKVTIARAVIASALVCILCNLLLNTYWLTFIIGKGFKVLLASRAIKELVAIPVMALLIIAMDRTVIKAINNR